MRPPGNYDALRQAEQQAGEAREAPSQPEAPAQPKAAEQQLDSAQAEPTRPTGRPAEFAKYTVEGAPSADWAKQIAQAAKERADAAKANEQAKGKDGNER